MEQTTSRYHPDLTLALPAAAGGVVGSLASIAAASAAPAALANPTGVGYVDKIAIVGAELVIGGWAASSRGQATRPTLIRFDDLQVSNFPVTAVMRPDVPGVFPFCPTDCGFQITLPIASLPANVLSTRTLSVWVQHAANEKTIALPATRKTSWPPAPSTHGGAVAVQPVPSIAIPDVPHMDAGGLATFSAAVSGVDTYLEYGCGGSTVLAANVGAKHIISIETSREWADAVRERTRGRAAMVEINYCDVGPVGDWGRPRDTSRFADYHRYAVTPWQLAKRAGLSPQVILVDGRFRVACFLYSLMSAEPGSVILFDDYGDRPFYHEVERFCPIQEMSDRMAVFKVTRDFSVPEIAEAFARYSVIAD